MTFVRGIQGYGKTTLVAGWLQDQPDSVRALWVDAKPGDDARTFAIRMAGELRRSGLVGRGGTPISEPSGILDCVALAVVEDQQVLLVIDNAHWLVDESIELGLIRAVARYPQLHVVLCSRGRHPIEGRTAGVIDTATITARALLFTVPQIIALAQCMGVPLTTERAEQIHSAIGGWAAAVGLVLAEIESADEELPLTRAGDYLREVVLPGIEDQQALRQVMRYSLAERLTYRLIRDLAEQHDPQILVRLVEASGLAERHYQRDDVELAFPCFVRDTLREAFAAREPEEARAMHRRLSEWYAAHAGPSHLLLAVRHAVAGEDWDRLNDLWVHHSAELGLEYRKVLAEVIGDLPVEVLAARPGLLVAYAFARVATPEQDSDEGRMVAMNAYLSASRRIATQVGLGAMSLHDLLYVGTGYLTSLRVGGKFDAADRVGDQIEQRVTALMSAGEDPGDRLGWFHLQRGVTLTLRAQHAAAARRYQLSWHQRRQATTHLAANAAANLALTHALAADPRKARRWIDRHRAIDTSSALGHHLIDAGARLAAALLALDTLDPEGCHHELSPLGDGSTPHELWPYVAYVEAQYGLHYGDPLTALSMLDAAQAAHHPDLARGEAARILLARARADLLMAAGKGEHAHSLLAAQGSDPDPVVAVASARLSLLAGDPGTARRIAANLLWKETTDNRGRLELLLIDATASHRMNDGAGAAELTRQALALYRQTNLLRPFTTLSEADRDALFCTAGQALEAHEMDAVRQHTSPFPDSISLTQLTPREQLLATALATTASRQEIADQLYVSVNTIRKQLGTLYRKLGVSTRDEALTRLAQLGLTDPSQDQPDH